MAEEAPRSSLYRSLISLGYETMVSLSLSLGTQHNNNDLCAGITIKFDEYDQQDNTALRQVH